MPPRPNVQLNTWWSNGPGTNGPHYGAAYLFVAYLAQHLGHGFLTMLVAEPGNGFFGIQATLDDAGVAIDVDDIFADWVVADWIDRARWTKSAATAT